MKDDLIGDLLGAVKDGGQLSEFVVGFGIVMTNKDMGVETFRNLHTHRDAGRWAGEDSGIKLPLHLIGLFEHHGSDNLNSAMAANFTHGVLLDLLGVFAMCLRWDIDTNHKSRWWRMEGSKTIENRVLCLGCAPLGAVWE